MPKHITVENEETVRVMSGLRSDQKAAPSSGIATFVRDNTNVKDFIVGDIPVEWKAFQASLRGLVLGSSVTSIGVDAFYDCEGFTGSLTIPDSVTTIGSYAFYRCSGFTGSLTIGNSVTTIGSASFEYCEGFTGSLTIPDSVTSIGSIAFYRCSGLDTMYAGFDFSAFTGSNSLQDSGITQIYVNPSALGWTLGSDQTIQGKSGITVSNWDNYPDPIPN